MQHNRRVILKSVKNFGLLWTLGLIGILEPVKKHSTVEVNLIQNLEFGKGGGRALKMDILRPSPFSGLPTPVLVWIHGGGWCTGSKSEGIQQLLPFANSGYLCASIEYRLSQEAIFPAQIEDCKCAIRFLRAHAKNFNLDPDRIGAWGASAGGHLAALLGTTGDIQQLEGKGGWASFSSKVQAVCDWFGPTDFFRINDFPSKIDHSAPDAPEALLIGGPVEIKRKEAKRANPITYVTRDDPPFLIMHADNDPIVPFNQSKLLVEALEKVGVEVTLVIVPNGGHGGAAFQSPEQLSRVKKFFDQKLSHSVIGVADDRLNEIPECD